MLRSRCLALFLLFPYFAPVHAQIVDAAHAGDSVDLSGYWRIHTGDDLKWSGANFDDSSWPKISTLRAWQDQGLGGYSGVIWYRLKVLLPAYDGPMGLLLRDARTSYQVFVDGRLIGQFGKMPPHPMAFEPAIGAMELPLALPTDQPVTIAIRFWHWADWARYVDGGIHGSRGVVVGPERTIQGEADLGRDETLLNRLPDFALAGLDLTAGLFFVLFWFLTRGARRRDFLWLGFYLIAGVGLVPNLLAAIHSVPVRMIEVGEKILQALAFVCILQFFFSYLRSDLPLQARTLRIAVFAMPAFNLAFHVGVVPVRTAQAVDVLLYILLFIGLPLFLLKRAWNGDRAASVLFLPMCLAGADTIAESLGWVWSTFRLPGSTLHLPDLHIGRFLLPFGFLTGAGFVISISAVALHRFVRERQELVTAGKHASDGVAAEMRTAREKPVRWSYSPRATLGALLLLMVCLGSTGFALHAITTAKDLQLKTSRTGLVQLIISSNDILADDIHREQLLKTRIAGEHEAGSRVTLFGELDDLKLEERRIRNVENEAETSLFQVAGSRYRINPMDGLAYVFIPPGRFVMGCSSGDNQCYKNEIPPHTVRISEGFWLGQTEVTQNAWMRVMGGENPSYFRSDALPVEQVTWQDAANYCRAAGGRLPVESEWEYAARGGTSTARYGKLDQIAAIVQGNTWGTIPVALKQPNAFGLYDVIGNVSEWVADWYDSGHTAKVTRGGSWYSGERDERASSRVRMDPTARLSDVGFRCIADFGGK